MQKLDDDDDTIDEGFGKPDRSGFVAIPYDDAVAQVVRAEVSARKIDPTVPKTLEVDGVLSLMRMPLTMAEFYRAQIKQQKAMVKPRRDLRDMGNLYVRLDGLPHTTKSTWGKTVTLRLGVVVAFVEHEGTQPVTGDFFVRL